MLYTAEECFLDCMIAVVTEKCGCRDIYMNTNGSDSLAMCNLLQYFSCIKGAKVEFYGIFEHRCKCPVSCEVTIFDPTFSDGSLSNHAVDSLLTLNLSTSLYWKLLGASETKTKMDKRKQKEIKNLFEPLNELYTQFSEIPYVLPAYLESQLEILKEATRDFEDVYQYLVWYRNCQSYVFSVGILQDKDAVSNYLSESTNEFLTVWQKRLERLLKNSDTQDTNTEFIYNQTVEDLQTRKNLIRKAEEDVTSLLLSFTEGVISHDIWFSDLNQSIINHFVPRYEMKEALAYKSKDRPVSDMFKYCKEEIINLYRNVSTVVDELIDFSESAFRYPENDSLYPVSRTLINKYINATFKSKTCRDILNNMAFRRPIISLESEKEYTVMQFSEYRHAFYHILQRFSFEGVDYNKIGDMLSTFKSFINMTHEFMDDKRHSITELYSVFSSDNMQSAISKLKDFSFEVNTRQQAKQGNLIDVYNIAANLWSTMGRTGGELLDAYYNMFNKERFLQNPRESISTFNDRIIQVRDNLDERQLLGHVDHDLINALDELAKYLDNFNKSISINSIFLRENFLQLDIFYRQLSYEHVSQQKGYDVFALICDIGGSLGLFIGASMLTVVEVIDLLLGQTPVFGKKTKFQH